MSASESEAESTSSEKEVLQNPEKKPSTKDMIKIALTELHNRKGTSLYAIKTYIKEKYNIDTEKNSNLIKKYLKAAVESGTILQTKGTGATGSFKLAKQKEEKEKKPKKPAKKPEKPKTKPAKERPDKAQDKQKKTEKKTRKVKKDELNETPKTSNEVKKERKVKAKKTKGAILALAQSDAKKRASIIKRKSLGSIIKAPKMKPKK
ncbi:unnamed protein product [Leptosia nina]|uniref:H15 domain-containing protein n=1 Tax=Leptosia nina TaxID=320188 RepID=A0AAV1JIM1_9NEOP